MFNKLKKSKTPIVKDIDVEMIVNNCPDGSFYYTYSINGVVYDSREKAFEALKSLLVSIKETVA